MVEMRLTRSQFSSAGLEVSHLCHRKLCINPMHLTLESHDTNQERIHCVLQGFCFEGTSQCACFEVIFGSELVENEMLITGLRILCSGFFLEFGSGLLQHQHISDIALLPDVFRKVYTISNPICFVSLRFFIFFIGFIISLVFFLMFLRLGHRRE